MLERVPPLNPPIRPIQPGSKAVGLKLRRRPLLHRSQESAQPSGLLPGGGHLVQICIEGARVLFPQRRDLARALPLPFETPALGQAPILFGLLPADLFDGQDRFAQLGLERLFRPIGGSRPSSGRAPFG